MPAIRAVLFGGEARRAASLSGPTTRIASVVVGSASSATSSRPPRRSGVSTGEEMLPTPGTRSKLERSGSSAARVNRTSERMYTGWGSIAPFESEAAILSAVRVAAVVGPPAPMS